MTPVMKVSVIEQAGRDDDCPQNVAVIRSSSDTVS